jgi:FAD/FMN-containing dehydrogenase
MSKEPPATRVAEPIAVREELADLAYQENGSSPVRVGDFGGVVERNPAAVVEARTIEHVERVFRVARDRGVRVVTRGTGHSCGGQSLIDGAIQLRNRLRGESRWISDDEIEVPSGATWRAVEAQLHSNGQAVPVVPSVLDLSVGGTLSVGGYGTNTPRRGAQIDQVRALELVAPDGRTYWCTPNENEQLFRFSLAGLGQLGVITRVRLATTEHRPAADLHGYSFGSLFTMARALEWMDRDDTPLPTYLRAFSYKPDRPGIALFGELRPIPTQSARSPDGDGLALVRNELGSPETSVSHEDVRSMEDEFDRNWVSRYPGYLHLWIDYGFDYPGFRAYCEELEGLARSGSFGTAIRAIYVSIVPEPRKGTDYFPFDIRPSGVERTFTCGIYCMVPADDPVALERVQRTLRECQRILVELGGRPYVYGFNQMGPVDWRGSFGDAAVDELLALKARVDPGGVIPPPWDRIDIRAGSAAGPTRARRFTPGSASGSESRV